MRLSAKAAAAKRKRLGVVAPPRFPRQPKDSRSAVGYRREDGVVLLRGHRRHAPAYGFPRAAHEVQRIRRGFGRGREHHARTAQQIHHRGVHAARLPAGDRTPRHEAGKALAQFFARDAHHLRLGAADVGDDGPRLHRGSDIAQHGRDGAHGNGDDDEVGAFRRLGNRAARGIDHAQRGRALEGGRVAIEADDLGHGAGAAQCKGEGASDEAYADDRERFQAAHGTQGLARARSSAARKRALCSGNPTVTRKCSGMP